MFVAYRGVKPYLLCEIDPFAFTEDADFASSTFKRFFFE